MHLSSTPGSWRTRRRCGVPWRAVWAVTAMACAMGVAVPARAADPETQSGPSTQNAADYYRQAAAELEGLSADDRALIESAAELHPLALYSPSSPWSEQTLVRLSDIPVAGREAEATVARLEPALALFRRGADSAQCDWGFDFGSGNLSSPLPQLPLVTDLVHAALFRARYHWSIGEKQEAVSDLRALKHFATHIGAEGDGGLISLVVQFNIERIVVHTISRLLVDAESARILEGVAQEPERPAFNLAKKALLLETRTVLPLARRLIDTSGLTKQERRERYRTDLFTDTLTVGRLIRQYSEEGLLDQIDQSDGHYREVGRLLDLPLDAFRPEFDAYMQELANTGNFFSDVGLVQCPGIERAYYDVKEMRVRWAMLQAAIDIFQSGVEALVQHADPFGDGPFNYSPTDDGFELRSELIVNGAPVTMQFNAPPSDV